MSGGSTVESVYVILQESLSQDNATRIAAEQQIQAWETNPSAPGFIGSLIKIAQEVQNVPEEFRLMALVVAKNAVGSSWRKTMATREWSHVPDDERAFVRNATFALLLQDPSERVALQAGLLITNIARFDVPRPWDTLLPDLASAAAVESAVPPASKVRALTALKHLLRALRTKRFVMEVPAGGATTDADLEALSHQVDTDRATMMSQCKALLGGLRGQWEGNFGALLAGATPEWEMRGRLAVAGLAALRELLLVLPDLRDVEAEFNSFMAEGAQAAGAIAGPLFSGPGGGAAGAVEAGAADSRVTLLSKCWERLLQAALVAMDRHTVAFAAHVPAWATLCTETALVGMDSAAVHAIRPKSRVLLTRFVARAMLQPFYRRDTAAEEAGVLAMLPAAARQRMAAAIPSLHAAAACLDDILSERDGRCAALVQAIVSKYIVLAPEELAEWAADPEGFARQVDVETSPDADTPRPCGVALLECALERAEPAVAGALVGLASALQAQPLTREGVLPREAVYRAVGECFTHLRQRVDFGAWYSGELRGMLTSRELTGLEGSVLRARALWLVGVCGEELGPEAWGEAFGLAVAHMADPDLVVALMAVSATTALVAVALDEQQFVARPDEQQRILLLEGENGGVVDGMGDAGEQKTDLVAQANAEFNAHMAAVEANLDALMGHCFALLPRLGEAESMVRVLQCVSATVELLGDRVRPHLASVTSALPRVWAVVQEGGEPEGTGGRVRLHCSLLAMLAHLIAKLGAAAASEPAVAAVLLPLLAHATNVGDPAAEPLLDDGLRLWSAVVSATPVLTPELAELARTRLAAVLRRGKDNAAALRIAEGYALHGGRAAIAEILPQLAAAIQASIQAAAATMAPRPGTAPGSIILGALSIEAGAEAGAALSLLGVLQRVAGDATELEAPVRAAAALLAADYGGGTLRLPTRSVGVMEAALEVVYRLLFTNPRAMGALTGGDGPAEARLLDRWVALANARDVGELFVPALAAAGRTRRHCAAVSLCALVCADGARALRAEGRAAQVLALGLRAAREQRAFETDQRRLAELRPADPEHQDQTLLRRLLLAREDPMRGTDAVGAVRAAAGHVAGWEGRDALLRSMEEMDPTYGDEMAALLAGQLPEAEADAAVAEMQHAQLS